jgi:hypothetical protein
MTTTTITTPSTTTSEVLGLGLVDTFLLDYEDIDRSFVPFRRNGIIKKKKFNRFPKESIDRSDTEEDADIFVTKVHLKTEYSTL